LADVGLMTGMVKNGDEPVGVGHGCCKKGVIIFFEFLKY
jgi:hypothetical protein